MTHLRRLVFVTTFFDGMSLIEQEPTQVESTTEATEEHRGKERLTNFLLLCVPLCPLWLVLLFICVDAFIDSSVDWSVDDLLTPTKFAQTAFTIRLAHSPSIC